MYACMHACMYVRTYVCMYVCMYVYFYVEREVYICVYTRPSGHFLRLSRELVHWLEESFLTDAGNGLGLCDV